MSLHRRTFLNTAAVAAAASIPGCMAVAPAAASICKAAPYVPAASPAPDPVFAAIARWRPLRESLDQVLESEDDDEIERHWLPANAALTAIYETEPTTPAGLMALMLIMRDQDAPQLGIGSYEDCADDLERGLWRLFRSAERLLNGAVQS